MCQKKLKRLISVALLIMSNIAMSASQQGAQTEETDCTHHLDVIAVVDGSDSIYDDDFIKLKNALILLTDGLGLDSEQKFGAVVFSSAVSDKAPLSNDKPLLKSQILNFNHPKDGTATHLGIREMKTMMEEDGRPGVPKVGIVITDGRSKQPDETLAASSEAKEFGINMFAVGVGDKINKEELEGIASAEDQALQLSNFDELLSGVSALVKKVCKVNGGWTEWSVKTEICSATCGFGELTIIETRTCTNPAPSNGGKYCEGSDTQQIISNCTKPACPVDGGWSNWSSATKTECSVSCGLGIRICTETRTCSNPAPEHGGQSCQGSTKNEYTEDCIMEDCPVSTDICDGCIYVNGIGYLPYVKDCARFIQCADTGTFHIMTCPPGLQWSQDLLTCVWPQQSTCASSEQVPPAAPQPPIVAPDVEVPCGERVRPVQGDPKVYEENIHDQGWTLRLCPVGTVFDSDVCNCVHGSGSITSSVVCDGCTYSHGVCYKPDRSNCAKYIQCVNNGAMHYPMSCASGLFWNQNTQVCDWPDQSTCVQQATKPPVIQAPVGVPECRPEVYLPFDLDLQDHSGKNNHVQHEGLIHTTEGYASFYANSRLRILRFSNMDFRQTLSISFQFHKGQTTSRDQAIVTNSDCDLPGSVYIIQKANEIEFRVLDESELPHVLNVPYQFAQMNVRGLRSRPTTLVKLTISRGLMRAQVGDQSKQTTFLGNIGRSHCALQIAGGTGYDNFIGDLDELRVYLCDNEDA